MKYSLLGLAALGVVLWSAPPAKTTEVVRDGIRIRFSIKPAEPAQEEMMQGQEAEVTFRITDEATDSPVSGISPGSWLDPSGTVSSRTQLSCNDRVSLYLKNIVGMRPAVDLNNHYLLVLNLEPSISVIDPRGGIAGRTNLLTSIPLKQTGADWVKDKENSRLFVSVPDAGQVAVISTENFKVLRYVDAGSKPTRLALQHDEKYLWVGNDSTVAGESGVTVIDTESLSVAGRFATGAGHHEIEFSDDDRYAFVTNRDGGSVSVIDIRKMRKHSDLATGPKPLAVAWSTVGRALYVADGTDGVISVIRGERPGIAARIQAKPGLGPLRFGPDGRWAFALNPAQNEAYVIDAATNALVHTVPVQGQPYQITFSTEFAYIRALASERVTMIPIAALGKPEAPSPNAFPAGAKPPKESPGLAIAVGMVAAVGEAAMYVMSPADRAVYYYMQGMNAPSGSFSTYGRTARAIEVIDRSLREREPGVYSTRVRLPAAGDYDVAFLLTSPKVVHCFSASAKADPSIARKGPQVAITYLNETRTAVAGQGYPLRFRLTHVENGEPQRSLKDVYVRYFAAPGRHRTEVLAAEVSEGVYEAKLPMSEAGAWYVYVACPSMKADFRDLPYTTVAVREGGSK